jgi:pilus assembly protein Flp/PilA
MADATVLFAAWGREIMKALLKRFVREEAGQDLIEYALLAGFISLVAVVAITAVGQGVNGVYGNINTQVGNIPGGSGS